MSFTIAIVGRPNVGKSTLFNRLLEQRKAIVDNISGVTRDRQYGLCEWNGFVLNVIDTGGFVERTDDIFEIEIKKQVKIAIEEANALIFMCDVTTGITDFDESVANLLRRGNKPVFLVVNKVDNHARQLDANEFYALGFDNIFFISSLSGTGGGELLDAITAIVPPTEKKVDINEDQNEEAWEDEDDKEQDPNSEDFEELEEEETEGTQRFKNFDIRTPKFALIGRPNAGKSSLLNALVGQERTIVSNIPGTTRDAIHTHYNLFQKEFVLIDTAGIRKKSKVHEDLEFYSVIRAIKAMDEADICLLLVDATEGLSTQDVNIFSLAERKGKGVVILINKWDLVAKETNTAKELEEEIRQKIAPFTDVPILFISATEKIRIFQVIEKALEVFDNKHKKISTSKLNDIMLKSIEKSHPPVVRGNAVRIKYVTQLRSSLPTFAFFTNYPSDIKTPYKNYLENQIRKHFNFTGVPIRIFFRKK